MNIRKFKIHNKRLLSMIVAINFMLMPLGNAKSERTMFYEKTNLYVRYDDYKHTHYSRYNPLTGEYKDISIFDDENISSKQYGADQKVFLKKFDSLINDPLIWEEMQNYFPLDEFETNDEAMLFYKKYFGIIGDCGCGYAAACNYVFRMFEGREREFELSFGFPMCVANKKGELDFNYELFMLKFFNYSVITMQNGKKEIMSTMQKHLCKLKLDEYANSEEYRRKMPKDIDKISDEEWIEWKKFDEERRNKFHELYENWVNASNNYINFGITADAVFGYLYIFLGEHNISIDSRVINEPKNYAVDDIIASEKFDLYNNKETLSDVGSHYVYVTDVNDDSITVSSWGNKYTFDNTDARWTTKILLKTNN